MTNRASASVSVFERGLAIKTSELLRRGRITPSSLSMGRYKGLRGDPDNAGEVADWLEANPLFDADMPDPATAEVEIRPDQAKFRRAVGEAYGWTCAVTGCSIREVLDAAHVGPKGAWLAKNSARDGVLMRTDLHRLFDAGLARIVKAGPGDQTRDRTESRRRLRLGRRKDALIAEGQEALADL